MEITAVITSCGRFEFLEKTLESLIKYANYNFHEIIIIDNSENINAFNNIRDISDRIGCNVKIIINDTNIGQVASIDLAYSHVSTKYIFHCEDDWEFFDTGFIELSLNVLENVPNVVNINLRVRFDGEKGSMHPTTEPSKTKDNVVYQFYELGYLGEWHGFSWNPGLRRKSDYDLIKPYKQYGSESGVGNKYKDLGYFAACLEKSYCKHIGTFSSTPKSNQ